MTEIEPIFSGKVNIAYLESSNPREIIPSHVNFLAEAMAQELKDMTNPLVLSCTRTDLANAREALKNRRPFALKIVVSHISIPTYISTILTLNKNRTVTIGWRR
jgi:hypothetical protein